MHAEAEIEKMNTNESENSIAKKERFAEMMKSIDTAGKAIFKRGKSTYYGIIEIDGKMACEQCKTLEPACSTVMHTDSVKSYSWTSKCNNCGNYITMETLRTKKDRKYWEG
jgi:ribosomal protein L44E